MNIKKYMMLGGVALTLGLSTSCVGDLDLEPIDPQKIFADPSNPEWVRNAFSQCYATMAVTSNSGSGDMNISAPNAGASAYTRLVWMMEEAPSDEAFWIWEDNGVSQISQNAFSAGNQTIGMAYDRIYQHLAICNSFISIMGDPSDPEMLTMRDEARALRAMSYYWVCDIWGNSPFSTDAPDGTALPQLPRAELYAWLVGELTDLLDNGALQETPVYGRVGRDGVEALLARVYLNAEVYTKGAVKAWDKCLKHCNNIINRHKGGGFNQSGLAKHYLYLFCGDNEEYMPGGGNKAENEILWGVAFDADYCQSYGGTTFLQAGSQWDNENGLLAAWKCYGARQTLSERFAVNPEDVRWSLWDKDVNIANGGFFDTDLAGYHPKKWTNMKHGTDGSFLPVETANTFSSADLALIRLADVYLMRTECYLHGAGNQADALEGVNFIRERAGLAPWTAPMLTADNLLDERSRELYFEFTRRSDLIRFGRYVGNNQMVWPWKGMSKEGTRVRDNQVLMPIPTNVLGAQPGLQQNPDY